MATDATGTPTSPDSIPTYNVNTDDPTGNGFNAAMAAIQTALSARANKPSGIVSGEVPVWNGTTWVRSSTVHINNAGQPLPLITTSSLAGGPPASPTDGDIWIATAVDANGTRWVFQFNAGSASAFKWEFIGGSGVRIDVSAFEGSTNTASWFDLTTVGPSYTTVRAGDYSVDMGADINHSVAGAQVQMGVSLGAVNPLDNSVADLPSTAGNFQTLRSNVFKVAGTTAAQELRARYKSNTAGTATFGSRRMFVTPIRVS